MSTQTAMDALANPTANDTLAAVPHHTQHGTVNDFIQTIGSAVVYVKAFDPTANGSTDDTTAVNAAHVYANAIGATVSYAGLTSVALQADAQIPVKTSVDFAQCKVVILGGVDGSPDWSEAFNILYVITDDDCPIVSTTGSVTASDLYAGSPFPTKGLFDGHGYAELRCEYQVPDRFKTGTEDYRQSFKVNRLGRASHPLSVDVSAYASDITVRYRKTSERTLTIRNLTLYEGTWNKQKVLQVKRCNVVIEDTTLLYTENGTYDDICAIISIEEASDITVRNFTTTGRQSSELSGTYALFVDGGADIYVEKMNALTGWGATAAHRVNGIHYTGCVLNRVDAHTSGHNMFVQDCDLHENGVVYGWGGGIISVRNSRCYRTTAVVSHRSDWGGSFFGEIIVDNVEVNSNWAVNVYVVDLATNPLGASTGVYAPSTIKVSNVTRTGIASGTNGTLNAVLLKVGDAAYVVYAPASVVVSNLASTSLPANWRVNMFLDILNMERAPGSNATTVSINGVRQTGVATDATGFVDYDSIRTPSSAVALRLYVSDCENFHAKVRLTNGPVIVIRDSGINGVSTVTSSTRARVDIDGCRFLSAASGYTNPPVGGGRSGNNNYTSVINSDFGSSTAFDCSTISLAIGNAVRAGSTAPLLPVAADLDTFFTGFRAAGAFQEAA